MTPQPGAGREFDSQTELSTRKSHIYQPRFYREWLSKTGLITFTVQVRETDLTIRAQRDLRGRAFRLVEMLRNDIENYALAHPEFIPSLSPLPIPPRCPTIVREMLRAAQEYGVGPMAAVAGAIAEAVGRELLAFSPEIIVENGGDIFLKMDRIARMGLYSGPKSPFTQRLEILVDATTRPLGVCTSSGTVGHSLSFGKADAVTVVAESAALADAAATAICNRVRAPEDVERMLEEARERGKLLGLLITFGKRMGTWGAITLEASR